MSGLVWCSCMVQTDGRVWNTVNFQRLNQASPSETHHICSSLNTVSSVPKHTFKTVAGANSGYHQIPLDEESGKFTTFITPCGYLHTPMEHCTAKDAFSKRFDDAITGTPRKLKCVDDTSSKNTRHSGTHIRELHSARTNLDSANKV